jgi:hypothetical protein
LPLTDVTNSAAEQIELVGVFLAALGCFLEVWKMLDHVDSARVSPFTYAQIIMLSASANKLSRLKEQAEEYAALIMEELDPEGLGYIEVSSMFLSS